MYNNYVSTITNVANKKIHSATFSRNHQQTTLNPLLIRKSYNGKTHSLFRYSFPYSAFSNNRHSLQLVCQQTSRFSRYCHHCLSSTSGCSIFRDESFCYWHYCYCSGHFSIDSNNYNPPLFSFLKYFLMGQFSPNLNRYCPISEALHPNCC